MKYKFKDIQNEVKEIMTNFGNELLKKDPFIVNFAMFEIIHKFYEDFSVYIENIDNEELKQLVKEISKKHKDLVIKYLKLIVVKNEEETNKCD